MEGITYIRKKGSKHIHIATPNLDSKRLKKDGDILVVSQQEYEEYLAGNNGNTQKAITESDVMPEIVMAMSTLNPDTDYTKDSPVKKSCPTVGALTKACGFDVNGTQRDEAWKIYQEQMNKIKDE